MTAPTYSDVVAFGECVSTVSETAKSEFLRLAASVDFADWTSAAESLRRIVEGIVNEYGLAASELGAQWYEYCRSLSIAGGYTAKVSDVERSHVIHDANKQIDKLFEGKAGKRTLVSMLSNVVSNTVYNQARETIFDNLEAEAGSSYSRDSAAFRKKIGYGIVTAPKACAFCIVLASRGYVYRSDDVSFHEHCKCVPVPFCDTRQISGYDKILEAHREKYDAAEKVRMSGDMPEELRAQIQAAKDSHEGEWTNLNETLIIMRYQNEGMV